MYQIKNMIQTSPFLIYQSSIAKNKLLFNLNSPFSIKEKGLFIDTRKKLCVILTN